MYSKIIPESGIQPSVTDNTTPGSTREPLTAQLATDLSTRVNNNSAVATNQPTIKGEHKITVEHSIDNPLSQNSYSKEQNLAKPASTVSNSNEMISRLQAIIDKSSETGTVSITKQSATSTTTNVIASTAIAPNQLASSKSIAKPDQNLEGIRHDNQSQLFSAKMDKLQAESDSSNQNSTNGGENKNVLTGDNKNQQSFGLASNTEQNNTFSQVASTVMSSTSTQSADMPKPILLPSGSIVHEQEILQQLINKFQVNNRLSETRLNIKLHPAELGELKINLQVKEGSVKVSVIAQSGQVQEVIERNLAKLKNSLENQGLTVDEILISSTTESETDFNHFDQQLFSNQDNRSSKGQKMSDSDIPFTLDEPEASEPAASPPSGVNVTA